MNYVFLDTCSWIDFASGKNVKSGFEHTEVNFRLLDSLIELKKSNKIVFLKNEIIDIEFKNATIDKLIEDYDKNVVESLKKSIASKIIPHCEDNSVRKILNQALISLEEVSEPFKNLSQKFNQTVWSLYNNANQINVSEQLKQKALNCSINKNHLFFENKKNNINDFLILFSIQEWIESHKALKNLDETSIDHGVYFVSKNMKDFGIDNNGHFAEELGVSQLITPINNLHQLINNIKLKDSDKADFLTYNKTDETIALSNIEMAIETLNKLIRLKKEFLLSFIRKEIDQIFESTKLKYVSQILVSKYEVPKEGSFPMVRSQNIINGKLIHDSLLKVEKKSTNVISNKGDVLVSSYGKKSGEYCINDLEYEASVHNSISVIRLDKDKVYTKYFDYFLRQYNLKVLLDLNDSSYMPRINISELGKISIKLPSLEKQNNLVKLFEEKEQEIESDILSIKRKIKILIL